MTVARPRTDAAGDIAGERGTSQHSINERHHRVLAYLDVIFGGYCVAVAVAAALAWSNGSGSPRTVLALLAFCLANGIISQISRRIARPVIAEFARAAIGTGIAATAYLTTDAPFGMWWLGFLIMALGGTVFFGLVSGAALPGRVIALYYTGALFLTEYFANPHPNWYSFSVGAGAIVMVCFLMAEIVALLDRALTAAREQTEALRLEKARSEQLLQKEAEAGLRASEEHFRTLIEHSSDGIAIVDRQGCIRYLSPAAERILGHSRASVVGKAFNPLVHPDDLDRAKAELVGQFDSPQEVRTTETRVVAADGSIRTIEAVSRVLPDGDLVANVRDVTERREMDRAFRAIVEGTARATGADFFLSLAEHLATALGVDHAFVAEVIDAPPHRVRTTAFWSQGRIVPNVEYGLAGTPCEHVIAGDMCYYPQGVQQAFPDDSDLVGLGAQSYLGMPLHDSAGQVLGHIAVLDNRPMRDERNRREILAVFAARAGAELERQRSESALRRLNSELEARVAERTAQLQAALDESSRLSAVLESTPDIVGIACLDGQMRYLNHAGRERLGLEPDERIESHNMEAFFTPASFETVQSDAIPTAVAQGTWSGELTMRSLSGEEIPVSIAGTAHFGPDGAPRYVSGIARDISQSKRIAAELASARDAAEMANRAKSTFLATMSHEIRTPMNAVIGMTDLLLTTALSPKQREFVETIRAGGDSLLTVINDILDFSKIEAGKLDLEHRAFDLRAAVESVVDLLAPRAAKKELELALSVHPSVPTVVIGDETRLRQILVNLTANGLKFTDHGEVVVSAMARPVSADSSDVELLFSIADTGIGIAPAKRDRLFTSFGQLDPSTTREYGGTGLGLAISKRLVELMGGSIWVESEGVPGRGSVFQFTIRVARGIADERAAKRGAPPALAGRRVLVVDDNATNRRILGLQLQSWGVLAVEAALPSDALDLLRRGDRFDFVILDMQMPGMDGVALAKAICAQRGSARLPIIMLTSLGHALSADAEAITCFAGCLTKPVKPSQLYDTILAALVGRDRGSDVVASHAPVVLSNAPRLAPVPLKLLLAEDIEVNRKFALLALEELGFHADVAANGLETLQALERERYDVILMDVQMPEMDGLSATRRIRTEWPIDRQPHIVAMTANAMRGDRELCLEAGMNDYLSKPVYLEELRAVLERAVARIATWRTLGTDPGMTPAQTVESHGGLGASVDRAALDRLLSRAGGRELIELFVSEADETLGELGHAVSSGDVRGIREAAHRLKGSSGYIGAHHTAALSAEIEQAARAGGPVDSAAVQPLMEELARLRECLLQVLHSTPARDPVAPGPASPGRP